jgi:transcription initiation factor IIE alpha subunit
MESEQEEMNDIENDILDILADKKLTTQEITEQTKWTHAGVYDALSRLKRSGEVDCVKIKKGCSRFLQWWAIETETDFTPNVKYKGPSYTHFLQGVWNEPREKAGQKA